MRAEAKRFVVQRIDGDPPLRSECVDECSAVDIRRLRVHRLRP